MAETAPSDPDGRGGARNHRPVRTYRKSGGRRAGDAIIGVLIRAGLVPHSYLLTTRGRKTGQLRTNPVTVVERDGRRWLVAPYGPVSWVHNARAAGRVTLRRRRETRDYAVREVPPEEAGPVLQQSCPRGWCLCPTHSLTSVLWFVKGVCRPTSGGPPRQSGSLKSRCAASATRMISARGSWPQLRRSGVGTPMAAAFVEATQAMRRRSRASARAWQPAQSAIRFAGWSRRQGGPPQFKRASCAQVVSRGA